MSDGTTGTMQVEIDLAPSKVNEQVAKMVIESTLGEAVKERIEQFLNDKPSYGSPSLIKAIEESVDATLMKIINTLMMNEYKEKVEKVVREQITDEVISKIVCSTLEKAKSSW